MKFIKVLNANGNYSIMHITVTFSKHCKELDYINFVEYQSSKKFHFLTPEFLGRNITLDNYILIMHGLVTM